MSVPVESIVRPFSEHNVFPRPFTKPGAQGSEMVRVAIGFQGTLKTMGYSFSATMTSKLGQIHREKSPDNSKSLKTALAEAADILN